MTLETAPTRVQQRHGRWCMQTCNKSDKAVQLPKILQLDQTVRDFMQDHVQHQAVDQEQGQIIMVTVTKI